VPHAVIVTIRVRARLFMWLGGGLFVASLAVCSYCYLVVWGQERSFDRSAIAVDAGLLTLFAFHHSVFARDAIKRHVAQVVGDRLVRSVYVWIASALFLAVCAWWRPIGGEVYRATGVRAAAHIVVQLVGIWCIYRAVGRIDALELAGIRPPADVGGLQTAGVYGWVRHPLYFGWILAVFATPHLTGDRLGFALLTTVYLAVAVPFEERSLVGSFGGEYRRYQERVRWRMIPFIY
jgi:protein-S-isoprenylcysteine O-methyltransferase Ste14